MAPRTDGFFQSGIQRCEDWHAGVHMVDDYFDYLKLYDDGRWLRKKHPNADLDFGGYLSGITDEAFRDGEAGRHPLDGEYDHVHQTGRYLRVGDELEFLFRAFLIIMHERRWKLRVVRPELLVSESGAEYVFRPTASQDL